MIKKIVLLLLFFSFCGISASDRSPAEFYVESTHKDDFSAKTDWTNLYFHASYSEEIKISRQDNFIEKPNSLNSQMEQKIRQEIFEKVIKISIDNEMRIEDLIDENPLFKKLFTRLVFSSKVILPSSQTEKKMTIYARIDFKEKENILDLILSSRYYIDKKELKPIESSYQPSSYEKLIIEARGLQIKPSFFPKIYTITPENKKILIYSLAYSDLKLVRKNGYVQFYKDLDKSEFENKKNYYCSAYQSESSKKTDIVINYNDYIKFFSTPLSLKNLAEGNLIILID
ncbi:MAG TPA: hypothetical protein DHW82_13315 [Spirochaetia bacterium]|nr:MAG: hypothetical protein A2Y41_11530 [Spirochaetes bacterium GWB1_36_13]HCL57968.1 hypothetical protein [Spirochaetia bacterium]